MLHCYTTPPFQFSEKKHEYLSPIFPMLSNNFLQENVFQLYSYYLGHYDQEKMR